MHLRVSTCTMRGRQCGGMTALPLLLHKRAADETAKEKVGGGRLDAHEVEKLLELAELLQLRRQERYRHDAPLVSL